MNVRTVLFHVGCSQWEIQITLAAHPVPVPVPAEDKLEALGKERPHDLVHPKGSEVSTPTLRALPDLRWWDRGHVLRRTERAGSALGISKKSQQYCGVKAVFVIYKWCQLWDSGSVTAPPLLFYTGTALIFASYNLISFTVCECACASLIRILIGTGVSVPGLMCGHQKVTFKDQFSGSTFGFKDGNLPGQGPTWLHAQDKSYLMA